MTITQDERKKYLKICKDRDWIFVGNVLQILAISVKFLQKMRKKNTVNCVQNTANCHKKTRTRGHFLILVANLKLLLRPFAKRYLVGAKTTTLRLDLRI